MRCSEDVPAAYRRHVYEGSAAPRTGAVRRAQRVNKVPQEVVLEPCCLGSVLGNKAPSLLERKARNAQKSWRQTTTSNVHKEKTIEKENRERLTAVTAVRFLS